MAGQVTYMARKEKCIQNISKKKTFRITSNRLEGYEVD
jgi:hypothetical protein